MIEASGLTFTYAGADAPAVRGIDFEIGNGEIFGFLGPSGAGKSTTQKILIGLLREYVGRLSVFGRDLRTWGPEYYERVGVSFEQPNHYLKLTALENLSYFGSLFGGDTEQPVRLLDAVGLEQHKDMRVGQFSKGMRNRLNVARSLINRPELLFLDEPTAGLDPVNAQRIRDIIADVRGAGATVFLTTHDMWTADQLCDRVAFIVDGEIPLIDSPRELKLKHGKRSVRVEFALSQEYGTQDDNSIESTDGSGGRSGADGARAGDAGERRGAEFDLDGLAENTEFLSLLRDSRVETIHTQEATLEDVFIEVTGRSLT